MDGFEDVQADLMPEFQKVGGQLGGVRLPAADLRSQNRDIVSKLCASYAPWWTTCTMPPSEKAQKIEAASQAIERLLDTYYEINPV